MHTAYQIPRLKSKKATRGQEYSEVKGYVAPSQDRGFVRNPAEHTSFLLRALPIWLLRRNRWQNLMPLYRGPVSRGGDKATSTTTAIALRL